MRGIRCFAYFAVLSISALALDAPKPPAPDQPSSPPTPANYSNIILITMDTTRADRMGFLGSERGLTPNLDALALDSVVFTRAYAQAPLTPASHATILTGTYPQYHQVFAFPLHLEPTLPYLPQILKDHGYHTASVVGSMALDPKWAVPGFDRGFDFYDAGFTTNLKPEQRYETVERRAGEVVKRSLAWLNTRPPGPFFLWVHCFDPHDPYDPPEPYKTRYAKAPYDGEIAYMDSALGDFFRQLKTSGLYENTLIVVTADHGESLGAHGEDEHGIFLYDETIHVPLLIKLPGNGAAHKRVEDRVELADIMPTVLGRLGIEVPKPVQGQSLLGFLEPDTPVGSAAARGWQDRGAYSRADYGHLAFAWSPIESLRTGKYLYVEAPRRELYDESTDAKAEHNLASASPAVAATLAAKLNDFQQRTSNAAPLPRSEVSEEGSNQLSALGYIARAENPGLSTSPDRGADPKDKIGTANDVVRINDMLDNHQCPEAIPELNKAIAKDPNIPVLHFFLGGCYLEAKEFKKALPELRKAVQMDATFAHTEQWLGRKFVELRDFDNAIVAFEDVVKADPNNPRLLDSHIYLIGLYGRANRLLDQIRECHAVLAVIPENYGANFNLGKALFRTGDTEGAIAALQKAIAAEPHRPEPHAVLAEAYEELGRHEDAVREKAEAERLASSYEVPVAPPDSTPETTQRQ